MKIKIFLIFFFFLFRCSIINVVDAGNASAHVVNDDSLWLDFSVDWNES